MTNHIPVSNCLKRATLFFNFFIFLQAILLASAFSWDRPFNNAANWGGTGLMETPNARILEDGVIRFGYAQALPYKWYTGGMGIFPGLEFSGRYTELEDKKIPYLSGFGDYKDKAFDLKYQILPESRILPAIAVGLHDFQGTQLFPAKYLVFSRQVFPFDFSIGLGTDRLKGPVTFPFWDEVGLFGGVEWAIHDRVHLMAEYNPIEYEKDEKQRAVPEGAKSPFNVGLRMKIAPGVDVGVSWQRGDTFGLMCHLQFKLGKPLTPARKPDPPRWTSIDRRPLNKRNPTEMVEQIQAAIKAAGFQNVSVYINSDTLTAEFENTKYLSNQKAAGRVLRILLFHSPVETQKLSAVFKRRQMPFLKISVRPEHLEKYIFGEIPEDIFFELLSIENVKTHADDGQQNVIKTEAAGKFDTSWGIKPMFQPFLNDPSGIFSMRIGIQPWASATLWKGGAATVRYSIPFYSDITTSVPPLMPDPVRSDVVDYLGDTPSLDRLIFDQVFRLSKKTFGRVSAGYFEYMYAGIGGEILTFWGDGKLALGAEGDWVRKREPGTQISLEDFETHTILGNIYYFIPGAGITVNAKYGRFLAGDVGWRLQLSREYDNGVTYGFWYSFTDTDDFAGVNRDYHDKGIFLSLPATILRHDETRVKYNYSVTPWTRDVAQTVSHWQSLHSLGTDLMPVKFSENLGKIKE